MLNKLLKEAHAFQTDKYLIYIVQIPYLDTVKFNISKDLVISDGIQEIHSQNKKLDFRWISGQQLLHVLEVFKLHQVTYYVPESIDFLEHFLVILQHERLSLLLRELVSQAQAIQELHADNNLLNHIFFQPKTFVRSTGGETLPTNDTEKIRRIKSIDPQISEETASFYRSVTKLDTPNTITTIVNTPNSNGSPLNKKKQKKVRFESATKIDSPFFCEICQEHIHSVTQANHVNSTLHQFNKQHKEPSKVYYLPESNVGYRLMKDTLGWQEDQGLGRENQGNKEPIKTRLKNDRLGLGMKSRYPLRVTHFNTHGGTGDQDEIVKLTRSERRQMKRRKRETQKRHDAMLKAIVYKNLPNIPQ